MTQSNENGNGSRLDRLEAIMLDLASATVRHDNEFSRINATLAQIAEQQQESAARHTQHDEWIAREEAARERHDQEMATIRAQQQLNTQDINTLTASIQELRNLLADYIQGRSQT